MKHISVLVPRGAATLNCIDGSYMMFTRANDFLKGMGREPLFDVKLIGLGKEPEVYERLFTVKPDHAFSAVKKTDLIIIPAVNGKWTEVIEANKKFLPWISEQYRNGAEVASLCVGTFLLAATGLLKGKRCATHWNSANDFRKMFPEAQLVSDKIITDEQGIYSSGGANSFWNLLLYLLEKYTDREVAIVASKYFALEIDRYSQSPFMMFRGQKEHEDDAVRKAQEYIEQNFQVRITVDQLSSQFAIGRRSLERRFKKATCNTVSEYIQRVKIEAAKKNFESSNKNVSEVMWDVGYSDTKAFRTMFKKITGLSPAEYRNKYNKQLAVA
jgi:transcriptional regulator GlxA family with amidase domain